MRKFTGRTDINGYKIYDRDRVVFDKHSRGKIKWMDCFKEYHIVWDGGSSDFLSEYIYGIEVISIFGEIEKLYYKIIAALLNE